MAASQTTPNIDSAAEYLRMAVAMMTKHRVPTTPDNYATWFAYVAGDQPELKREIDCLIAENTEFTLAVNARLYKEHIARQDVEKIERIRASLTDLLRDVVGDCLTETSALYDLIIETRDGESFYRDPWRDRVAEVGLRLDGALDDRLFLQPQGPDFIAVRPVI